MGGVFFFDVFTGVVRRGYRHPVFWDGLLRDFAGFPLGPGSSATWTSIFTFLTSWSTHEIPGL